MTHASNDVVLALVIITGVSFDFANGFHDTANAMATSIATKAAIAYGIYIIVLSGHK